MGLWHSILTFFRKFRLPTIIIEPLYTPPMPPEPVPVTPQPVAPLSKSERLYNRAKSFLGRDASPLDIASDDVACMESIDDIIHAEFGIYINGTKSKVTVSTKEGLEIMQSSPLFREVVEYGHGQIIICATGEGKYPWNIPNGHIGICGDFGIMSNDSATGKFLEKYNLESWTERWHRLGGYPIHYFELV